MVTYRNEQVDDIPTVMAIKLRDVQSRDSAEWEVKTIHYAHDKLDQRVLSPAQLGTVQNHDFWRHFAANEHGDETNPQIN